MELAHAEAARRINSDALRQIISLCARITDHAAEAYLDGAHYVSRRQLMLAATYLEDALRHIEAQP